MDKQAVREAVWDAFEAGDQARFPFPPRDRIPNFAGADAACERLTETTEWADAETLKCNPDAPQLPVRRAALRAGKTVYVAQPRLRSPDPFLRLDPDAIGADGDATIDDATTVSGISTHGTPVAPEDVPHVDLVVSGSVAVTTDGARIGKGEGYSDLEWGVLSELDAVDSEGLRPSGSRAKPGDEGTTTATTVHELSVLDGPKSALAGGGHGDDGARTPPLPRPDAHDVPLDLIATPERTIRTETPYERPSGIDWGALDADRLDAIPVLAERAPGRK
ncbi:5-formyltetrahydrofolate cyclo-ligase [Halorubrum sp. AD140]|uniref:5-formyltetrahydrofolate cyclo-ligase n=1 Tax=Halorubrum sp. AD140 TaxID=3050073 RepID=UPI002ACC405E|nr:5-formyltetrahydrofolate cyclo-ligase [Halorubrum sp. AD140]MDZ5812505.1 5-formyltetrahydrofolate cyclo-ligase [Halorubrum sp. AD140]